MQQDACRLGSNRVVIHAESQNFEMFRSALRRRALRPAGWPSRKMEQRIVISLSNVRRFRLFRKGRLPLSWMVPAIFECVAEHPRAVGESGDRAFRCVIASGIGNRPGRAVILAPHDVGRGRASCIATLRRHNGRFIVRCNTVARCSCEQMPFLCLQPLDFLTFSLYFLDFRSIPQLPARLCRGLCRAG